MYRVVSGVAEPGIGNSIREPPPEAAGALLDTFQLYADYPDPFLDSADGLLIDTSARKEVPVALTSEASVFPNNSAIVNTLVQYKGEISNRKRGVHVAIVTIHGKVYLIGEHKKVEEVYIQKVKPEEIRISYKGASYVIKR